MDRLDIGAEISEIHWDRKKVKLPLSRLNR
jgi:hypothetical protein